MVKLTLLRARHRLGFLATALLLALLAASQADSPQLLHVRAAARGGHSQAKLSQLRTLTFYNGELTTSRRGKPVQQMTCVGEACRKVSMKWSSASAVGAYESVFN